MENLNHVLEEYRYQCLGTVILKLQIDREERWRNSLTFYRKCMYDPGQLFQWLEVQFSCTTGEDESMDVVAITVKYKSSVLKNAADRAMKLFEGKDSWFLKKVVEIYTCIK